MPALVAVICTFLNADQTLEATLQSLAAQTVDGARYVLVDDGSNDGGTVIAERFCANDSRFVLFKNPNPGRARALNLGISEADTEYVAILDADDVAHPMWLQDAIDAMRKRPEFAVISFERLFIRGLTTPNWADVDIHLSGDVRDVTRRLAHGNPIGHSGAIMHKHRLMEVSGYNEKLPHLEDYDLWIRLAEGGKLVGKSTLVRIAKRYHAGQKFGHTKQVVWASWQMQLRAAMSIDRSFHSLLSLLLTGARELARGSRQALGLRNFTP